jgi:uncharacterized phage-like protein YoqJ
MREKMETAAFTGHRVIATADVPTLRQRLEDTVAELAERGITRFLSGGALGFDTLAALAVLKRREADPRIKRIIVQPCRDQAAKWRDNDKQAYQEIIEAADEVICLSEEYYDGCMKARNEWLAEHSAVCVAYLTRRRSGVAQTVRFAAERGLEIINLANSR